MLNKSIFPRMRSEIRGCVTPNCCAASLCVIPALVMWAVSACMGAERIFKFSASPGVSSRASHTIPYRLMVTASSRPQGLWRPALRGGRSVLYELGARSGLLSPQLLTEDAVGALERVLRLVEGQVSQLKELTGVGGVLAGGDADADPHGKVPSVQLHRLLHRLEDAPCHHLHLGHGCGTQYQESELVAPEPRSAVPGSDRRREDPPQSLQHLVPDGVPSGVVDGLEVVDVDEEHGDQCVLSGHSSQRALKSVDEQAAVRQ